MPEPTTPNGTLTVDHLAPQDKAIGNRLWAYKIPDGLAPLLNGAEPFILRVRGKHGNESQATRTAVDNKPAGDDASTFLSAREKDVTGVSMSELAVAIGFVVDEAASESYQHQLKQNRSKTFEEVNPNYQPTLKSTPSAGLVVKLLHADSHQKGFYVLMNRVEGLCFPKPLKKNAFQHIAFFRAFLPFSHTLSNPKALAKRKTAIRTRIMACVDAAIDRLSPSQVASSRAEPSVSQLPPKLRAPLNAPRAKDPMDGLCKLISKIFEPSSMDPTDAAKLAERVAKTYEGRPDLGTVEYSIYQLLCRRDVPFNLDKCREVWISCKKLWPDDIDDEHGIFAPAALLSLALALRHKEDNGQYSIDYFDHVEVGLYKGILYLYSLSYHMEQAPMPQYDAPWARVHSAWLGAKALPQAPPYVPLFGIETVSEKGIRGLLNAAHRGLTMVKQMIDSSIAEGVQTMGVTGASVGTITIRQAADIKKRGLGTLETRQYALDVLEQEVFLNTTAYYNSNFKLIDHLAELISKGLDMLDQRNTTIDEGADSEFAPSDEDI